MDIGFDDPDVLLHYEQLKVQDLEMELGNKIDKLKVVEKQTKAVSQENLILTAKVSSLEDLVRTLRSDLKASKKTEAETALKNDQLRVEHEIIFSMFI